MYKVLATAAIALAISVPALANEETLPESDAAAASEGEASSPGATGSGQSTDAATSDDGEVPPEDGGTVETQGVISGGVVGGETQSSGAAGASGAQDQEPYSGDAATSQPGGPGGTMD